MSNIKKIILLSVFISFWTFISLQAEEDFCEQANFQWEIAVDFLEWKPNSNDLEYAGKRTHTDPNVFKIHRVNPQWESGVRTSLILPEFYLNWDIIGSYTYINSSQKTKIMSEDSIVPVISHPALTQQPLADEGRGKWNAEYQEWTALLGYDILSNEYYQTKVLFGAAGIILNESLKATLEKVPDYSYTKWKIDCHGAGLRLGAQFLFRLSENFEFLVHGNGSLLGGTAASKNTQKPSSSNSAVSLIIKDKDFFEIITGFHLGGALLYETSLLNVDSLIKVGYEFLQWQNVPNHRIFVSNTNITDGNVAISTSSQGRNFGFNGFYLSLMLKF